MPDAGDLQVQMIALVRAFGLHRGDQTPCGKPVSVAEAHALLEIGRHQPLSQSDLVAWLRLEKSSVSRLVGKLVQQGWVVRERDSIDARVVQLALTSDGRRIAAELAAARSARFAAVLAAIPEQQRANVVRAIATLVEAIDASQ